MKNHSGWFLVVGLTGSVALILSLGGAFSSSHAQVGPIVYGRVGAGPDYPDDGTITFIAYLQKAGADSEIITEDNYNCGLGQDLGYEYEYFKVDTDNFSSPKVTDGDSLRILFTGIGAAQGYSGAITDTVDLNQETQNFGNSSWGSSINPSAPTGFEASNVSPGVVDLSWHPSTLKSGVLSYRLYRSSLPSGHSTNEASDGHYFMIATGITDTTYRDSFAPQVRVWYVVIAADSVAPDTVRLSGHSEETTIDAALPVQLIAFTARGDHNSIILEWTTESEWNNRGFHLWRRQEYSTVFQRITSQLIPGAGDCAEPRAYRWEDRQVKGGVIYWYQLESVDFQGTTQRYGPVSATPSSALPTAYGLSQNYPNPFNPETWISYQLPEENQVTISIYNIKGQLVKVLVDETLPAGAYRTRWDGRNEHGHPTASGVYFCRMNSSAFTHTIKMILLK